MSFLPVKRSEISGQADFVLVSADAYVDHPSFGHAIVSRLVESKGFSVGIIPQPVTDSDYTEFKAPRHAFFVSGGVVDSMVNNYTVAKRRREKDEYSEGGQAGRRPDRAVTVYCRALKRLFPETPIIIGGIEASLRRFAHYDYWSDRVMPSILVDSGADLLIYGMGEKPLSEMLALISKGAKANNIRDIRGTAYLASFENLSQKKKDAAKSGEIIFMPSYESVIRDKIDYIKAFNIQRGNSDPFGSKIIAQKHGESYVIANPPQYPLTVQEMDFAYSLPYMRAPHPMYKLGVPAIKEVKYSLVSSRGCFGNCSYCALSYHQGRLVQKRSKESIVKEAEEFLSDKEFKGYIHDVGGPTANFRNPSCLKQAEKGTCTGKECIGYSPCKNLSADHSNYLDLLRSLRKLEGIKKVFIRSGIRYDYLLLDKKIDFLSELVKHHISGQLKVAPEHSEDKVLKLMNKAPFEKYIEFKARFEETNKRLGKEQYLVPYFISSHPGSTLKDAVKLAEYLHSIAYMPEQVQDFYPTPSTKSTCMYYTGLNPDTLEEVYVPKSAKEKKQQRALLQYRKKENYETVKEALIDAERADLIGFGANCLIKPLKGEKISRQM